MHLYLEEQEPTEEQLMARAAQAAPSPGISCPCCAAPRSATAACSRSSTRSSTTCRRRRTSRRSRARDPKTGALQVREHDDNEPFSALAFKIQMDPQGVGKLTFFRVYSGRLKAGSAC